MTILLSGGYVLCICAYAYFRIRVLWKRGEKNEAWGYAVFTALSAVIGALLIGGAELPSLVVPYRIVLEALGKKLLSP